MEVGGGFRSSCRDATMARERVVAAAAVQGWRGGGNGTGWTRGKMLDGWSAVGPGKPGRDGTDGEGDR